MRLIQAGFRACVAGTGREDEDARGARGRCDERWLPIDAAIARRSVVRSPVQ